jgi:hypothetical protein
MAEPRSDAGAAQESGFQRVAQTANAERQEQQRAEQQRNVMARPA